MFIVRRMNAEIVVLALLCHMPTVGVSIDCTPDAMYLCVWCVQGSRLAWFDEPERKMLQAFTLQTAFKFLMSESDKLVMTYSAGLYEQGVYAVVTNYGSPLTGRVRCLLLNSEAPFLGVLLLCLC